MYGRIARRAAIGVATLGMVGALGACDSLLEVENFGAINEGNVSDPVFAPEMANAAVNEFQTNFSFLVFAGATLTDEAVTGHNYQQWEDFDLRLVEDDNTQLADIYEAIQSARATGEDMVGRLRDVLETPASNEELATALTYTGLSYTYLAEYFCYAPVEPDAAAVRSDAIFRIAMDRFEEAVQVSVAAGREDLANLARVGAARAALGADDLAAAASYAGQVPTDFVAWVRHKDSPTALRNELGLATAGTNTTIGVDAPFRGLNDRRVRHAAEPTTGHNQKTLLWLPYQSESYEGWTAEGEDVAIDTETSIRLASGLEARYILAEAGAMSAAELETFINERRAVGGQVPFSGTDLQAELRDQRRRDLFLDGHRLGDLRRYLDRYGVDQFPSGPHPNDAEWGWGSYGTATCFIPHRDEATGNPNYEPLD